MLSNIYLVFKNLSYAYFLCSYFVFIEFFYSFVNNGMAFFRPFLKSLNEIYLRSFGKKIWILDSSVNNRSNMPFIMNTRLKSCAKKR